MNPNDNFILKGCEYTVKKKKTRQFPIMTDEYAKFNLSNACSPSECTGLITVPAEDEQQLENFMDIYDFGPPIINE